MWLALLCADHVQRKAAVRWWAEDDSETIAFCRFAQMAVLRLLTSAAAMNGRPITMRGAWLAYDELFGDDRIALVREPSAMEPSFRKMTAGNRVSPKLWGDARTWPPSESAGLRLVTFDRALASQASESILLT